MMSCCVKSQGTQHAFGNARIILESMKVVLSSSYLSSTSLFTGITKAIQIATIMTHQQSHHLLPCQCMVHNISIFMRSWTKTSADRDSHSQKIICPCNCITLIPSDSQENCYCTAWDFHIAMHSDSDKRFLWLIDSRASTDARRSVHCSLRGLPQGSTPLENLELEAQWS